MRERFKKAVILVVAALLFITVFYFDMLIVGTQLLVLDYWDELSVKVPIKEESDTGSVIISVGAVRAQPVVLDYWDTLYSKMRIKKSYKIVYRTSGGGETSYGEYLKYVAKKRGWQIKIVDDINPSAPEVLAFDPDFILICCLTKPLDDQRLIRHRSKKYFFFQVPYTRILDFLRLEYVETDPSKIILSAIESHNLSFDGFIVPPNEVELYHNSLYKSEKFNKKFYALGILSLVPEFDEITPEPQKLVWVSSNWDRERNSITFKSFIYKLNSAVPMSIYGYDRIPMLQSGVYKGMLSPGMTNIDAIRKGGIYLLTHSGLHIESGMPTTRIFEAAAAGAVIISDLHPFVIKHFGNSVLYFDRNASAVEMRNQVKAHFDWIQQNPKEAKELAERSHQIFLQYFTLERDLDRIAKMHEYIIGQQG